MCMEQEQRNERVCILAGWPPEQRKRRKPKNICDNHWVFTNQCCFLSFFLSFYARLWVVSVQIIVLLRLLVVVFHSPTKRVDFVVVIVAVSIIVHTTRNRVTSKIKTTSISYSHTHPCLPPSSHKITHR